MGKQADRPSLETSFDEAVAETRRVDITEFLRHRMSSYTFIERLCEGAKRLNSKEYRLPAVSSLMASRWQDQSLYR